MLLKDGRNQSRLIEEEIWNPSLLHKIYADQLNILFAIIIHNKQR